MKDYIEPIGNLINCFSKLPGVGNKTAARYAYYVIEMSEEEAKNFANSIIDVKDKVKFCSICGNYSDSDPCIRCQSTHSKTICVVEEPKDVTPISNAIDGNIAFHILHGTISPLNGKGPDDIRIKELLNRVSENDIEEIILATNSDVEGEATAMYISRLIKPLGIKVTRIAQGVSMGSNIEFIDQATLTRAIENRKEY